ncbi:MAG: hypothetical protein LBE84_06635 [Planctomycetota bacterium]|jgi:hypothetical protein|nr:hypothetical protein [Planctomycetota bacterium]
MHLSSEYTPEVILADAVRLEIAMAGYHMRACFTPPHPNDYRAGAARLETLNAVFPI